MVVLAFRPDDEADYGLAPIPGQQSYAYLTTTR